MKKLAVILPPSLPIPPKKGGSIQTVVYDVLKRIKSFEIHTFSKCLPGMPKEYTDQYSIRHHYLKEYWFDNFEIVWQNEFLVRHNNYIYKVLKKLKVLKPDIVHIHNRPHYVPIVRKHLGEKVKIILTDHNQKIAEDSFNRKRVEKIIQSLDAVVDCSKKILELDLLAHYPKAQEKAQVIYNSVDTNVFKFKEEYTIEELAALKAKYGVEHKKVLLFIGRLVEEKAVAKIIKAFKAIVRSRKEVVLMIVGSSFFAGAKKTPYVEELEKSANSVKDAVFFTGFVDPQEIPRIYALADIFVSPADWEDPSPKVMYEAAAVGLPIVSTQRGGIPEIVEDAVSAILLPRNYSEKALEAGIISLLDDPRKCMQMGAAGRKRMEKKFSSEVIAKEWEIFYNRI